MNLREATSLCNALNAVIHNRNLFKNARRYINAHVARVNNRFEVRVEDLHAAVMASETTAPFVNDGSFRDCNGSPVIL